MNRDLADAIIGLFVYLEKRLTRIQARQPREEEQVAELVARFRAAANILTEK